MTAALQPLAFMLFDAGAFELGEFTNLKHQRGKPTPTSSPVKINLRTCDLLNPGPLNQIQLAEVAAHLYSFICECNVQFDYLRGVPESGKNLAKAVAAAQKDLAVSGSGLHHGSVETDSEIKILEKTGFSAGETVLLLDDVVTSGESASEEIVRIRNASLRVSDLVIMVDREQGGTERLRNEGCTVHALFTLLELTQFYETHRRIDSATANRIRDYLATAS